MATKRTRKPAAPAPAPAPAPSPAPAPVISYKGFDQDFRCRGHQFEVGKTYAVSGKIEACLRGFHACENPFDVWDYYGPGEGNRFAIVEQAGDMSRSEHDSKIASAVITIQAELSPTNFIRRAIAWIIDATKDRNESGNDAQIGSSGNDAQIGSSGNDAQIGSSGNDAQIGSSGDYARIGASGDYARIGASGDYARIGSSGDDARIDATGRKSIVACAGASAVKGRVGTHIAIMEYADGLPVGFCVGVIGQGGLEPGVWYVARGGKLVAEG